jgi:multiple sugar transport system substrate-binding protein
MKFRMLSSTMALALMASVAIPGAAMATDINMWVRASGAAAAQHMIDLWNSSHPDKVNVTVIPDNQMVTKLATGAQSGDVPDMVSFDLVYMADFMNSGVLLDLTDDLKADPNYASVAQAYKDIATWDGKIYGAGFTPDVSVLIWNKDLFKAAGLDPDKAPTTMDEIHADAKKITALGNDTYGYYFSGACPGCNIFVTSPLMVATGSVMLPAKAGDKALTGDGVAGVLTVMKAMWDEKLIPASAQADNGANFLATFETGKIGIQGTGGFAISALKHDKPDMNFGIGFLPGLTEGQHSAFVGGDVIAIPAKSAHADVAKAFIHWELTDEAQLEGLAKNNIIPSRPTLADNKYFTDPRVVTTAKAVGIGYVPGVLHYNDMVNSDGSPWIQMLQTAIFNGDVDGAVKTARDAMEQISSQ